MAFACQTPFFSNLYDHTVTATRDSGVGRQDTEKDREAPREIAFQTLAYIATSYFRLY